MLIIHPSVQPACIKHFVRLTKEWRFGCDYKLETKTIHIGNLYNPICYEQIVCDLNHEYMHFLLHEFVHFVACWKFDNLATLNSDLYNITNTDWINFARLQRWIKKVYRKVGFYSSHLSEFT